MPNGSGNLLVVVETILPCTFLRYPCSLVVVFPIPIRQFHLTVAWSHCWATPLGPSTLSSLVRSTSAAAASAFLSRRIVFLSRFLRGLESDGRLWLCLLREQHTNSHCSPYQDWPSSVSRTCRVGESGDCGFPAGTKSQRTDAHWLGRSAVLE